LVTSVRPRTLIQPPWYVIESPISETGFLGGGGGRSVLSAPERGDEQAGEEQQ